MDVLESNLEAKAKYYEDPSLGYIFLMNNNTYIVEMTNDTELGILLGDEWFRKHTLKIWHYHVQYQKTLGTMPPILVQDFFPLLYNKQHINKIHEWKGSERSKAYKGNVPEREASLSQQPKRYQNFDQIHLTIGYVHQISALFPFCYSTLLKRYLCGRLVLR
jgi:hypothetical protein